MPLSQRMGESSNQKKYQPTNYAIINSIAEISVEILKVRLANKEFWRRFAQRIRMRVHRKETASESSVFSVSRNVDTFFA